jgi:RNA polymerase sigma factor (sigma-70 family)
LLGSLPDAEDAFQATFLVLCRKARTIARHQSLGSWLYKVAFRICLGARATRQRQPGELPIGAAPAASESVSPLATHEMRAVLDEELNRLPEKYRAPLVLHYLESKTVEQTAAELGWPYGTVCVRLTRGKDRLRVRLVRRGLTLSTGAIAALLAQEAASAAIAPGLAQATIQAAVASAPGMGATATSTGADPPTPGLPGSQTASLSQCILVRPGWVPG